MATRIHGTDQIQPDTIDGHVALKPGSVTQEELSFVPGGVEVYEQASQPSSTNVGALWIDSDEAPPAFVSQIPLVTSLPGSPIDGQEVYYQSAAMAADGVVWHLRYRASSSSAYKWEYLGGPPLSAAIDAATTVSATGFSIWTATVRDRASPCPWRATTWSRERRASFLPALQVTTSRWPSAPSSLRCCERPQATCSTPSTA